MIVDDFQKQIDINCGSFTDDELGLFHDSILCFHSGIYRPSYILAYQGMMIYFRRLIQNAKMPSGFDSSKWKKMQANLAKDKEWEEEVNNAIRKRANAKAIPPEVPVLSMNDSLRMDFDYWRNRRNDSAHYKEYDINDSHVLSFYSFLNQYLLKITVEGGKVTLLNEFKDACDVNKTSPKKSLQPLIDKILTMVSPEEMDDFFAELDGAMGYRFSGRYEATLASIIKSGNEELKGYVIKFVRSDKRFKAELINDHPDLVGYLIDKKESREFWMKYLAGIRNRVAVLARMLMVGLIDPAERDEALCKVLEFSFNNNDRMGEVTEEERFILKANGFFDVLRKEYFNGDFTSKNVVLCGKNKYEFFYGYVVQMPVDKELMDMLLDIFSRPDYPYVWANIFKERFLNADASYKAKFDKLVNENGITLPDCLRVE